MKTLLLLRHAEAAYTYTQSDLSRPLTPQGRDVATHLGRQLRQANLIPDRVLCSPAIRTRQTLENLNLPEDERRETIFPEAIYNTTAGGLYDAIRSHGDESNCLLIVAHNPAIHGLARFLAAQGERMALHALSIGYPPGTLSVIDCPCSQWKDMIPERNILRTLLTAGMELGQEPVLSAMTG